MGAVLSESVRREDRCGGRVQARPHFPFAQGLHGVGRDLLAARCQYGVRHPADRHIDLDGADDREPADELRAVRARDDVRL